MVLTLVIATLLTAVSAWAQVPSGRWDGTVTLDTLKVPFTIYFEGAGATLTGSFVNGDSRVPSASGSFEDGMLRLSFQQSSTRLEASLANGMLQGSAGDEKRGMHPFTASAYCTCAWEGEAGPEIMGAWEVPDAGWQLTIRRKGEDTYVTLSRDGDDLGPIAGRFNGAFFELNYFDGTRGAVLEIEPRKDLGLDLALKEPGQDVKKYKAARTESKP